MKTNRTYLQDILERTERLEKIAANGQDIFVRDVRLQDAAAYNFEVIGEIVKRLPKRVLERGTEIRWFQINELSDFLAHNYDQIEVAIVWRAIEQLSQLRAAVEALLCANLDMDETGNGSSE